MNDSFPRLLLHNYITESQESNHDNQLVGGAGRM